MFTLSLEAINESISF